MYRENEVDWIIQGKYFCVFFPPTFLKTLMYKNKPNRLKHSGNFQLLLILHEAQEQLSGW